MVGCLFALAMAKLDMCVEDKWKRQKPAVASCCYLVIVVVLLLLLELVVRCCYLVLGLWWCN